MDAEHHDLVLAITSHLPHLIAYNIVGTADDLEDRDQIGSDQILRRRLSRFHPPRGLRSDHVARRLPATTRRRSWKCWPVFRRPVRLQRAIRWGDGEALFDLFTRTRGIRRAIIEAGQETDEPDFGRHHQDLET